MKQKDGHDRHAHPRVLYPGQSIMAKNFRSGDDWIPGVIVQQLGPLTYMVDVANGRLWKCHVDHLKECSIQYPRPFTSKLDVEDAAPSEPSSIVPASHTSFINRYI